MSETLEHCVDALSPLSHSCYCSIIDMLKREFWLWDTGTAIESHPTGVMLAPIL